MDSYNVITWMIIICLVFGCFLLFSNQFKFISKILARAVAGCAGFWIINAVLSLTGIGAGVGVNLVTAFTVGLLGVPGFVSLYIVRFIL